MMKFIYISNDWKCSMAILTNLAKVYLEYNFVCVLISESNKGAVAPAADPVDRSPGSQKFYCFWTTSHPIPTTNLLYNLALLSIVHIRSQTGHWQNPGSYRKKRIFWPKSGPVTGKFWSKFRSKFFLTKIRFGHCRWNFQQKKWGSIFFRQKRPNLGGGSEGSLVKDHTFAAFFLCTLP